MKILHVCPLYYPAVGGVENVFRAVSEGMVRRGEDVTVFTTTAPSLRAFMNPGMKPLPAGEEVIQGVRVRRFPHRRVSRLLARGVSYAYSKLHLPGREMLQAWSALPWVPHLVSEVVGYRPDIVLAGHFLTRMVVDVSRARNIALFPLVYHTALHLDTGDKISNVAVDLLKNADAVWVNTVYEKNAVVKRGIQENKVFDLGVGVDPENFLNGHGQGIRDRYGIGKAPLILFVGRKEEAKGIKTLLDAMIIVRGKYPDAKVILAGAPTPFFESRYRKSWRNSHGTSLISLDFVTDEEKRDIFAACDLFVLPSRIESFGIVYLEAWMSGKPVIGADIGSTRCIIDDGEDGYLVRFGDAAFLAKKIMDLLDHPLRGKEMGARGRKKVLERYTWEHITDRLLDLYRSLVK
ncbi:MAG: glycosyltransferase family 4 protein [Nitrospirae bacterium]|nr:glycosyltransferase family 4 protein [Nitrospirota bacterium]